MAAGGADEAVGPALGCEMPGAGGFIGKARLEGGAGHRAVVFPAAGHDRTLGEHPADGNRKPNMSSNRVQRDKPFFLFGGFGLEWLYWSYLSATLKRIELSNPKTYGGVLKAAMIRATLLFGSIAVFAFGSIGLFGAFEWSPILEHVVISLLTGIIVMRLIIMIAIFILAPKVDELRLLPLDRAAANSIYRWILAITGVGLIGVLVVDRLGLIGIEAPSLVAVETLAGLIFVTVMISALWQINSVLRRGLMSRGVGADVVIDAALPTPGNFKLVFSSAILVVAFLLWLAGLNTILRTLVTVALLVPAIKLSRIMVDHIFDQVEDNALDAPEADEKDAAEGEEAETDTADEPNRYKIYRPIADRLIRFLLVIVAVLTLGIVWDVTSILDSTSNSFAERVFGVVIDIVFALLIADLVWTWAKTAIEQKLATYPVPQPGHPPGPEARTATLLPMFEKVLMITIIIMVALIIISSLGVNIGPILAGAGVLGIALGFGAQALVNLRTHIAQRCFGKTNIVADELVQHRVKLARLVNLELVELQAFDPRIGDGGAAAESGADAADIDPVGADDRETDQLALEEIRHMDDDIVEMLTGDFLMVGDQHVAGFETVAPMLRNRVLDDDAEIGNEVRHAAGVLRQQPAIGIDHRGAEIPDLAARRLRPVCASCPGSRG